MSHPFPLSERVQNQPFLLSDRETQSAIPISVRATTQSAIPIPLSEWPPGYPAGWLDKLRISLARFPLITSWCGLRRQDKWWDSMTAY